MEIHDAKVQKLLLPFFLRCPQVSTSKVTGKNLRGNEKHK